MVDLEKTDERTWWVKLRTSRDPMWSGLRVLFIIAFVIAAVAVLSTLVWLVYLAVMSSYVWLSIFGFFMGFVMLFAAIVGFIELLDP